MPGWHGILLEISLLLSIHDLDKSDLSLEFRFRNILQLFISQMCDGATTFSESAFGTFESNPANTTYGLFKDCSWIVPSGGDPVTVGFTRFDLEEWNDYVKVFECVNFECIEKEDLVKGNHRDANGTGIIDGHHACGFMKFTATSGIIQITFHTDHNVVGRGFEASWCTGVSCYSPDMDCHSSVSLQQPLISYIYFLSVIVVTSAYFF